MEVVKARAALLSNYEVYDLLKELESDHIARAKTAVKIKKEEEAAGHTVQVGPAFGEASENLRTVEIEAIQYLSADSLPTQRQTPEGIAKLVKALEPYGLTKAEKLQIVNLAPTLPVELYVIVEELEDRVGDRIDEILELVRSSLIDPAAAVNGQESAKNSNVADAHVYQEDMFNDEDGYYEEEVFDDTGEGAGVEGDLDMEDD